MNQPVLEVREVAVHFGGIVALDGVSFDIPKDLIVGLIGPNGAGKTTLFNCLSRLYTPNAGEILFKGQSLLGLAPNRIASLGIGRTFQNLALFPTLSVLDNVMIGGHSRTGSDFVSNAFRLPWVRREESRLMARAMESIEFMELAKFTHAPVGGLPFGYQKRVELARARSPASRNFCCSTSLRAASTTRSWTTWCSRYGRCGTSAASPSSWSSTI